MDPLHTEFVRLYHAEPQHALLHDAARSPLCAANGQVRCAVLELARPADWGLLGAVWRGVQAELDLPAPGIAINGCDGYQLWFSWEQPVDAAQAHDFVARLVRHYLAPVPPTRLRIWPAPDAQTPDDGPATVPAALREGGPWSAFIAPDLAAVFADEPWLDREPGPEAQGQLLARLHSQRPAAFARALEQLPAVVTAPAPHAAPLPALAHAPAAPDHDPAGYPCDSPTALLQAVLQDPQAPLALRVQAAAALLAAQSAR